MRWLHPRLEGMIAISSFLAAHYDRPGFPVVRVPPLLDVEAATAAGAAPGRREVPCHLRGQPGQEGSSRRSAAGFARWTAGLARS